MADSAGGYCSNALPIASSLGTAAEVDWTLLESRQKLQREKCVRDVVKMLWAQGPGATKRVEEHASVLLCHDTWEGRHGGLLLLQEYLNWQEQGKQGTIDYSEWVNPCLQLLADKEVRVRTTSGETVALLCRLGGLELYDEKVAGPLLSSIESNITLERDGQAFLDDDEATKALAQKLLAGEAARQLKQATSRASRASSMQSTMFYDTAGWGTLETDVACLQQIVEKCGAEFAPRLVSQGEVLELLFTCAVHMNRFVRAIAFRAIDAAINSLQKADSRNTLGEGMQGEPAACTEFLLDSLAQSSDLVARLGSGLCDEWANVRMEASVALRTFLLSLQTSQRRQCYYDELLPRICVNRYYVAVGVASYTRETWLLVLGDQGKEIVARWLPSIVPFYIMQTKLANSEARDAAAKCIGELAARVDRVAVSTYAMDLFEALLPRLSRADAWEVKVSVCTAITDLVRSFPDLFHLSTIFANFIPSLSALLADTIWSVREGAAITLGELVKVSEENAVGPVLELCLDGLNAATREIDEREKYGIEDFATLKRERNNDVALHSNQDTIDCCAVGELEPDDSEQLGTLRLSAIYNQAQKNKVDLRPNSWERTDGCLYLVRELALTGRWKSRECLKTSSVDRHQVCLEDVLALMAHVASLRHFIKHLTLLTTLWNVLPETAKAIGVEPFEQHVGGFVDSLAYSVSCEDGLTVAAAKTCIVELDRFLGRETLSRCIRRHNAGLLDTLSACLPPQ